MSGVKVIRHLLAENAGVQAIVDDKVIAGTIPLKTVLPAVGVSEISAVETKKVGSKGSVLVTSRVQASVKTKNYPQQKELLDAVTNAISDQAGMIQGVDVVSISRDVIGPDLGDDDAEIFVQTQDFMVKFREQR